MKYLLLVHHNEESFGKMSEETRESMLAKSIRLCHRLDGKGEYVHASPLRPVATAAVVRMRDGNRSVTDGPFIETREHLVGYFLIDARSRGEAIEVAGRIPGARLSAVEVRPVRATEGLPGEYEPIDLNASVRLTNTARRETTTAVRKESSAMQRITPCLWFDDKAEEAARFYVSVFQQSKLGAITRYGEAGATASGRPEGSVMTVTSRSKDRHSWRSTAGRSSHSPRRSRSWCSAKRNTTSTRCGASSPTAERKVPAGG